MASEIISQSPVLSSIHWLLFFKCLILCICTLCLGWWGDASPPSPLPKSATGESDNDVESVNSDEFLVCLFNQFERKKDAAKRIEGFLSALPAKKIDDNSFAYAALKKLFVQYNTSLPSSAAVERLFSSAGHRKFKLNSATANSAKYQ